MPSPGQAVEEWDELARLDPLWAIVSERRHKFGRWDFESFFATGEAEVAALVERTEGFARPQHRDAVIDVGCGVGRLAPALCSRFSTYLGVDLSPAMVDQARRLHADRDSCTFAVSDDGDLGPAPGDRFDLVLSIHVLQHLPSRPAIMAGLIELVGLLRPGGLLTVQLPAYIPWAEKAACDTRRWLYLRLRRLGIPEGVAFRLGLFPMTMSYVPESEVVALVAAKGARVLGTDRKQVGVAMRDCTYHITTRP